MKYLSIVFSLLFFQNILIGQKNNIKKEVGSEPYPAPVMYNNLSVKEAAFIDLFNDKRVTNLHLYSDIKNLDDYFYKGRPIRAKFSSFFDSPLSGQTYNRGNEPHAVFSLRGGAEELYIVRMPGERYNFKLVLFDMENGKLEEVETLAEYYCKANKCVQIDSWIQDVNGDTRLDIIQKRKITMKNGREKIKTTVFLMDVDGDFNKSKKLIIDTDGYRMQDLW